MREKPVFGDSWSDLRGGGLSERQQREALARELRAEVAIGHPLHGQRAAIIAQSSAADDIIVELAEGGWAHVHLTWIHAAESPPWPVTTFYETVAALEQDLDRAT
ncbi:hypothetical protein [Pseudofrankia sp. DC12]|uniref:hypothetical protein n=1 Tax=Pseudofrankia sp. DC12 TaxID=683315 RepID=UPI0005F764FD|nr:hypothetical protein [Pseudofrankia sp. DC12]